GAHYAVGLAAGERVLLPAVRSADKETLIIADGFSCREQIEQETDRRALHSVQVLQMGIREKENTQNTAYPERKYIDEEEIKVPGQKAVRIAALLFSSILAAGAVTALIGIKRHKR